MPRYSLLSVPPGDSIRAAADGCLEVSSQKGGGLVRRAGKMASLRNESSQTFAVFLPGP